MQIQSRKKGDLPPLPEPAHLSARVVGGLQWWDNRNLGGEQYHNIFRRKDQVLFWWSLTLLLPCCNGIDLLEMESKRMIISLMALPELNTTKEYDYAGEENVDCPQLYSLQKVV